MRTFLAVAVVGWMLSASMCTKNSLVIEAKQRVVDSLVRLDRPVIDSINYQCPKCKHEVMLTIKK